MPALMDWRTVMTGGLHVFAEELDVLVLVGMDAAGVAAPDEVGQFDEDTVGVLEILGLVDGEDGGDLLVVELVAEDGFHAFDKEDVRAFGDADARAVRDDLRRLGDDVGVERDLALGVGFHMWFFSFSRSSPVTR